MKKETKLLKEKATSSLLLSIDHFNRPWDVGRLEAVLILLDHSFEMLMKASILNRGGRIRELREKNTIGFDACVRRALSSHGVKFLSEDQALVLQSINGLRDAAQHHILDLSEGQLYLHAQSGVTLFRDILRDVFGEDLAQLMPERALPISTVAPVDPIMMFTNEMEEVRRMLAPGTRKRAEAEARLRGLAIVNGAIQGQLLQPGSSELRHLSDDIIAGKNLAQVFPGIASIVFTSDGSGPQLSLRIVKKEGVPVSIVPEGTPDSGVVALRRVGELDFYNLGHKELAAKVALTTAKLTAAISVLDLKKNGDCFKEFKIGATKHGRYSQRAIEEIKALLGSRTPEQIWAEYKSM